MIAIYPGRARVGLLVACFASSCLFADLVWAQDPVPVPAAVPSEIQPAGTVNESLPLTVFGWGNAEPAAAAEQPATSAATTTQESAAAPGHLAPQDTLETSVINQSADGSALPATTPDTTVGAVLAPNAEESMSNAAAEPAAAGPVAVESSTPVPATETQASVSPTAEQLPDTLGGESSPSASSVAIEVTAIKTLQSQESTGSPPSAPAAIGAAESTSTPAP